MIASLGIGEVTVYRGCASRSSPPVTSCKSVGTPLAAGEIYDSNRYTLYGMLTRLGCEVIDMGVMRDDPEELERAFVYAAAAADVVITTGGVSVGEADYVKQLLDQLGEVAVLEDRDEARPAARLREDRRRAFLRPARQSGVGDGDLLPVRARRAADPAGAARRRAAADVQGAAVGADQEGAGAHRVPARHPFARRRGGFTVRTTGDQGSGILSSMSQANCFIVLRPTWATSPPASWSTCSCSKGWFDAADGASPRHKMRVASRGFRRRPAASTLSHPSSASLPRPRSRRQDHGCGNPSPISTAELTALRLPAADTRRRAPATRSTRNRG